MARWASACVRRGLDALAAGFGSALCRDEGWCDWGRAKEGISDSKLGVALPLHEAECLPLFMISMKLVCIGGGCETQVRWLGSRGGGNSEARWDTMRASTMRAA